MRAGRPDLPSTGTRKERSTWALSVSWSRVKTLGPMGSWPPWLRQSNGRPGAGWPETARLIALLAVAAAAVALVMMASR